MEYFGCFVFYFNILVLPDYLDTSVNCLSAEGIVLNVLLKKNKS